MQVDGTTPLWIAARVLLYGKGNDFFQLKEKVLDTFDPEDIHDLRVASRRLREGLDLFSPCYPPVDIVRLLRKVKRVTRHLGEMRNTDEALLFFSSLTDELGDRCRDDLERLTRLFEKRRGKGLKELRSGLKRLVPPSLRDTYLSIINSPRLFALQSSGIDLFAPLALFASDAIAVRLAAVVELVPAAREADGVEAQHRLRIAVKHFRYRLEILSFLAGSLFPEIHETLKRYQEVLGKMHDLDAFAGIVREAGFPPEAEGVVLETIGAKREQLFTDFTGMLTTVPFEQIDSQLRSRP
jgi:CHAD domain-containing protein